MYNMQHHTCSSFFALLSLPRCTSLSEVFLLLYSWIFTSFIPGLSDKIKQRCINQAFCSFMQKAVGFSALKDLTPNPSCLLGFLPAWVCDIRRQKGLAASVVWTACASAQPAWMQSLGGRGIGICLEAHTSVPWTEGRWVFIWVMGSINDTGLNSCCSLG